MATTSQSIALPEAKKELARINSFLKAPHLLIGGLAVQQYVPTRDSSDIDLVCEWETARTLIKTVYPSHLWNCEEKNQDEYRPSYVITPLVRTENKGKISFGPKILQRRPYNHIDWEKLKWGARPFEFQNVKFDNIIIPAPEALAFTKLISFIGRDKKHGEKRKQDLDDFVELTNLGGFQYQRLYILISEADAVADIRRNFWPENSDQEDILSRSILFILTHNILGGARIIRHASGTSSTLAGFVTVAEHLKRLNVPRDNMFVKAGYFESNPDRKCIGTILSVDNLRGVAGISADMISTQEAKTPPPFPSYVMEEIPKTKIEGRDGDKAVLTNWHQLPLDIDEGKITLEIAPAKYRAKIAMRNVAAQLAEDLVQRRLHVFGQNEGQDEVRAAHLPCHLHCDGIVLTGDNCVVLAQRGSAVDLEPMMWAASFGESIEWDIDKDKSGTIHPVNTIWRGLEQELGLHKKWVSEKYGNSTRITFMELGFQLDSFIYILFTMIELPNIGIEEALDRARNHRTDKETREFGFMNFTADQCVSAIVGGAINGKSLNYSGRFGLLLASLNKLGTSFERELAKR